MKQQQQQLNKEEVIYENVSVVEADKETSRFGMIEETGSDGIAVVANAWPILSRLSLQPNSYAP